MQTLEVRRVRAKHPISAPHAFRKEPPGAEVQAYRPTPWIPANARGPARSQDRGGEGAFVASGPCRAPRGSRGGGRVQRFGDRVDAGRAPDRADRPVSRGDRGELEGCRRGQGGLGPPLRGEAAARLRDIATRHLKPRQVAPGITAADGSPRWTADDFRHFAVSLWIDEGAAIRQVLEPAGHDAPDFTRRVHGHLFSAGRTERRAISAGEQSILGRIEPATWAQHGNDKVSVIPFTEIA